MWIELEVRVIEANLFANGLLLLAGKEKSASKSGSICALAVIFGQVT